MNLSQTAKKLILVICLMSVVIILGGALFHGLRGNPRGILPFALGVAAGSGVSVLKVISLERSVGKVADMQTRAAMTARIGYFGRLLITGAVLVAAHFAPFLDLYGAVFGVITMNLGVYFVKLFVKES